MCLSGYWVWPGLGPAAELLFFASPKKSSQKKGEPKSGALRASLRCSRRGGNSQTCPLRGLRTCEFLIPTPLRCSARPHGEERERGHLLRQLGWRGPHPCPPPAEEGVEARSPRGGVRSRVLPSGCAEERSGGRKKGCACLSEASLRRPRSSRAPQVARSAAKGHSQQGRLCFGYFWCLRNFASQSEQTPRGTRLWRTKKTRMRVSPKVPRPPGRDPAKPPLRSEQSQRPR